MGSKNMQLSKDEQTNAVCTVTIAAAAGRSVVVHHWAAGYNDRNLTFALDIESPTATLKWRYPVHGADGMLVGLKFAKGDTVTVKLPAGGATKVGYLSVAWEYED